MIYNVKTLIIIYIYIMETATIIVIFVSSLLLGITTYSIYTAFGPTSKTYGIHLKNMKIKK
ncbi:photosystem II protein PsbN (plastid) [Nitzschia inconspicua]|uniref:Photosystem II protein PsbN n=1 Tax=Nitzschia inconspicua TaxID=303405 RepID=A0A8H2SID3_9STRA|nr:photosystem II protein PsbN [Nitzschia inconspicua]